MAELESNDTLHPRKTKMTMEKQPVEDVCPIKHGCFSIVILLFLLGVASFSWLPSSNFFGITRHLGLPGVPLQSSQGWDEARDETAALLKTPIKSGESSWIHVESMGLVYISLQIYRALFNATHFQGIILMDFPLQ